MPITKKKVAKGLPKRTYNPTRKRKYERYLFRATCSVCRVVFRTPAHHKAHEASGHQTLVGSLKVNRS